MNINYILMKMLLKHMKLPKIKLLKRNEENSRKDV